MNQNPPIGFVFSPGWAMPPDFFAPLQTALLQYFPRAKTHSIHPAYFDEGQLDLPDWPQKMYWFGIGHSYGLMRLLRTPAPWRGMISLCGFTYFCAHHELPGVAPEIAQALRQGMLENSSATLRRFYRLCGLPGTFRPPAVTHLHTLLADLDELLTCRATNSPMLLTTPLLALASKDDAVVPVDLTNACFVPSSIHWHPTQASGGANGRGHALGMLEPAWCAEQIAAWINRLFASAQVTTA